MKNFLIVILLVATIAFGSVCVVQRNRIQSLTLQQAQSESRAVHLESQLKQKSEAIEQATLSEQKAKILQKTLTETSVVAEEKAKHVEQLEKTLADSKTNDLGGLFAGMFKDPKMKEMIKGQQKAFMGPMIDMQYGSLFEQLKLSPEQATGLKDLLGKRVMAASDMGLSMLSDDMDAAKRTEMEKQMKSDMDASNDQIKKLLGDDNYSEFQNYEKTMPDRMTVTQFKDQLAGGSTPLSSDQEQQLVQAMNEERTGFKWTTDYNQGNSGSANYADMFSQDKLDQFAKEKEQFDQQFQARAKQILTPDQLTAFESFQAMQRQMQVNAMKMAGAMFGKKTQ